MARSAAGAVAANRGPRTQSRTARLRLPAVAHRAGFLAGCFVDAVVCRRWIARSWSAETARATMFSHWRVDQNNWAPAVPRQQPRPRGTVGPAAVCHVRRPDDGDRFASSGGRGGRRCAVADRSAGPLFADPLRGRASRRDDADRATAGPFITPGRTASGWPAPSARCVGSLGPVTPRGVVFQEQNQLKCVDPLSGELLWIADRHSGRLRAVRRRGVRVRGRRRAGASRTSFA